MQRLTLFAKGNVDVRDSLVAQRIDGRVTWNGINEVMREQGIPCSVRVRHETLARSDLLHAANGSAPEALQAVDLDFGAHPLSMQASVAIFDAQPDAFILSIQADLFTSLLKHRKQGFLFHAAGWREWPDAQKAWMRETFEPCRLMDAAQAMDSLERVVARIRERSQAPVLVYNVSTVQPGESVSCYQGVHETFSTRAKRFNLALIELSQRSGISIVDVDRVVARMGADRCKLDQIHLDAQGCKAVAGEVVRVLDELGVLPARGTAA